MSDTSRPIHKLRLGLADTQTVRCDQPLAVAMQNSVPTLWFTAGDRDWQVHTRGTGHEAPPESDYLGLVFDGPFVWHFFIEEESA